MAADDTAVGAKAQAQIIADSIDLRLADFGSARNLATGHSATDGGTIEGGTPQYWPPERFAKGALPPQGVCAHEAYAAADAWALGCVLFACLSGAHPFGGNLPFGGNSHAAALIRRAFGSDEWCKGCHDPDVALRTVVTSLLEVDPSRRLTMQQAAQRLGASSPVREVDPRYCGAGHF